MNILELFAGSCSFSNAAKERGHNTFTTDRKQYGKIDYVVDIFDFDADQIPFDVDFIWASPPCTYFSVASIGHHWHPNHTPKSKEALVGVAIVKRTLEIIEQVKPRLGWLIENPRGKLRKLNIIDNKYLSTVTYCQYGDTRMKPTDIWTNLTGSPIKWIPRKMCKNGDDCHVSAPRGSKCGTQGLKSSYERSKVPAQLCEEIVKLLERTTHALSLPDTWKLQIFTEQTKLEVG